MSETEVAPKVPPDWRDWINEWPSVKSIAFFAFVAWIITAVLIWAAGLASYFPHLTPQDKGDLILKLLDRWLDALNWLTAAAVFGVVGKFATTKPDVIRAEGEVKAAVVAVQAAATAEYPVPGTQRTSLTGAPAGTDPDLAKAIGGGVEGAILEQEAQRRREKHELSPPIAEEAG